jgi:hypothetical protein
MLARNKIAVGCFVYEDFKLPVFVVNPSLTEDIFPSITGFSRRWISDRVPAKKGPTFFKSSCQRAYEAD